MDDRPESPDAKEPGAGGIAPLTFEPGARIGRYQLLRLLGRGGMGEVFEAEDTVLKRPVALKVLPPHLLGTPDRLARFEREARLAALISHPNVVPIHDFGREGEVSFLVQELVSGRSLERILEEDGPPSPAAAVGWVLQACEGLAAAHEAGILHRDVKPANLMLGADGRVRILDFGLAIQTAEASDPSLRNLTREGVLVGTASYVSPEQAMGQKLDERGDVFSLGIVLYELLAGRRPFEGATPLDILHAVARQPHAPLRLGPDLAPLVAVVDRALSKAREERPASVRRLAEELREALVSCKDPERAPRREGAPPPEDARTTLELREARSALAPSSPRGPARAPGLPRAWIAVAGALLLATLAAILIVARRPQTRAPAAPLRPTQVTSSASLDVFPSFSPDGSTLYFASDRGGRFEIYRRALEPDETGARRPTGADDPVTDDLGENVQPAVSPDGLLLAYHSIAKGGIWILPLTGRPPGPSGTPARGPAPPAPRYSGNAVRLDREIQTPRRLTDFGCRPSFSPDGRLIAFESGPVTDVSATALGALPPSVIWVIPTAGGVAHPITEPGAPPGGHSAPSFSPDGRWVAFSTYHAYTSEICAVRNTGGELRVLAKGPGHRLDPIWAPSGRSVYFVTISARYNMSLSEAPFAARGDAKEPAVELHDFGPNAVRYLALSRDGRQLAYSSLTMSSNLQAQTLEPIGGAAIGPPTPLTRDTGRNSRPAFSPDGRQVAFSRWRPGAAKDIWVVDVDGGNERQVTTEPGNDDFPAFVPGGLAYVSMRDGRLQIYERDLASGKERRLAVVGTNVDSVRISPDARRFSYNASGDDAVNVWVGDVATDRRTQVTHEDELAGFACWSPDGRELAIEVKRDENLQLAVIPAEGGPLEVLTPEAGQSWPWSFSADGNRVAYACQRGSVWNVCWASRRERERRRVTTNTRLNVTFRYPAFSPRGDLMVWEHSETFGNVWMLDGLGR